MSRPASQSVAKALRDYHRKRDLGVSGEPGSAPQTRAARRALASAVATQALSYVIQKHDATRLHYDLRLEMAGVLRSWAVPKGLPTEPGAKVLAVEVEDHPLDYASFEGVIPKGHYGAGAVMVWDRGRYLTEGGDPVEEHRRGKIDFALAGEKCTGSWTLVRLRRSEDDRNNWLLIKRHEPTRRAVVRRTGRDRSVKTNRTLAEIARAEATPEAQPRAKPTTRRTRKARAQRAPIPRSRRAGKAGRRRPRA